VITLLPQSKSPTTCVVGLFNLVANQGFAYTRGVRLRSRPLAQAAVWLVGQTLRMPAVKSIWTSLFSPKTKAPQPVL
jgi:hypothetical protein